MSDTGRSFRVFAADLDDTILGDPVSQRRFRDTWEAMDSERRPLLIYNTGRSVADTQWLVLERRIPAPNFIIGGIGTEVHDPFDAQASDEFRALLSAGWDRERVLHVVGDVVGASMQPPEFCSSHKLGWHWPRASRAEIFRLEYRLREAGLDVLVGYTAGIFLDILPRQAGKGNALAWLCRRIGVSLENVLVAGAGGNNASMFRLPGVKGILVGNASHDLLANMEQRTHFLTPDKMADGVLAGLGHFGLLRPVAEPAGERMSVFAQPASR